MNHPKFDIAPMYLTSVTVKYGYTTDSGMYCSTTTSVDHPAFDELRKHLGARGFISIEKGWWNGDRVIKPFTLNDHLFMVGEKFVSACAMNLQLKRIKQ